MFTGSSLWSIALVLGSAGLAAPVAAEPADRAAVVPGEDQDIIVTGDKDKRPATSTKLPLTLKETPQSVTVVDRQRIEDFNLNTIADVLAQTPGVTVTSIDSNRTNFNVRGFAVRNFQYDGVPTIYQVGAYANSAVSDMALYDRVEIVRGAAGLMAGVGDPSATVNLVRKRAPTALHGTYNMQVGSWSYYRLEGDVGGPLNKAGTVRARIAGAYTDKGSFVNFQHDRSPVLYGTIEADVTPTTRIRVGADYLRTTSDGGAWGLVPLYYSDGGRIDLPRSYSGAAAYSRWYRENTNLFAAVEQDLAPGWLARVTYNRRLSNAHSLLYQQASGTPDRNGLGLLRWDYYGRNEQNEDSIDGYVSGKVRLFGRDHEIVGGINHYERRFTVDYSRIVDPRPYSTSFPSIFTWNGSMTRPTIHYSDAPDFIEGTKETGAYGVVRLNPADWIKVIAGGRYTDWRTRRDNYLETGSVDPAPARRATRNAARRLVPYGGVVIDVTRAVSLYASYAEVFSPVAARNAANELLSPTTGVNYEAGVKATPFGPGFTASAAGFHIKQDNIAIVDPGAVAGSLPGGGTPYISVSGVKTWGGEAELAGEPLPGWTVSGSYTYARSEDNRGARTLPQFPLHIARLYTTWRVPGERLTIGGGINAQSRIYVCGRLPAAAVAPVCPSNAAQREIGQNGWVTLDLLARYRLTDKATAGLNVTNVFDRSYFASLNTGPGGFYATPRRVMGNIRVNF